MSGWTPCKGLTFGLNETSIIEIHLPATSSKKKWFEVQNGLCHSQHYLVFSLVRIIDFDSERSYFSQVEVLQRPYKGLIFISEKCVGTLWNVPLV